MQITTVIYIKQRNIRQREDHILLLLKSIFRGGVSLLPRLDDSKLALLNAGSSLPALDVCVRVCVCVGERLQCVCESRESRASPLEAGEPCGAVIRGKPLNELIRGEALMLLFSGDPGK